MSQKKRTSSSSNTSRARIRRNVNVAAGMRRIMYIAAVHGAENMRAVMGHVEGRSVEYATRRRRL